MSNKLSLRNGLHIPDLCYGSPIVLTYKYGRYNKKSVIKYWIKNYRHNKAQYRKDKNMPEVLQCAMENGCNMFDTSRAYAGSEGVIGNTLKGYKREDYFVVTKLCNKDQYSGDVRKALMTSLSELGIEYVDLYLMHWPVTDIYIDSWKQMEQLYKEGLCKAIGVCNCNIHHLEELKKHAEIMPMVNQFECHPLFTQNELREYCRENDIQVMAYTSTARMDERLRKTVLVPIAKKYKKSITQVILRWHQQIGNIPIVSSSDPKHFKENTEIGDFSLTDEEIQAILDININSRLRYDPDNCDFTKL